MNYSRVVIILFSTGLQESAFSIYSFGKTRFSSFYVLVFRVSVCLCFCCCIFIVLHSFEFSVIIDLITQPSQSGKKIDHVLFTFVVTLFRSSHRRCFIKKAVLKNFAIFTWKHLCLSLCLIKLHPFRSVTLLKRNSNSCVFLCLLRNF